MIAMPQATTAPYIQRFTKCEFDRYLLIFCKNEQKFIDSLLNILQAEI